MLDFVESAVNIISLAPADALLPGRYTCVGRRKKNRGPQASMSFPIPLITKVTGSGRSTLIKLIEMLSTSKVSEMVSSSERRLLENLIGIACAMAELSLSGWHGLEAVDE
jgi:hypothetical protein